MYFEPWRGQGERIRHTSVDVPDVVAHRVEVSEFLVHGTERFRGRGTPVALRMVLVTDVWDRQANAFGYGERAYPGGRKNLYRLYGQARRRERVGEKTLVVYDLNAYHVGAAGPQASRDDGVPMPHALFRLQVDEQTGAAQLTLP
jgi:hypothetical protein